MTVLKRMTIPVAAVLLVSGAPAMAGWKLVPAQAPMTVDAISVVPQTDWNQASSRPGKQGRVWTRDGFSLNAMEFFSAVPNGAPLYRERDKKRNPMPKFDNSLLLPELADFFERSFRAHHQPNDFSLIEAAPGMLGTHPALNVSYSYTLPNDDLVRLGEARLAVVDGKLYVANYHAPKLHYFDASLPEAVAMMDAAKF